MGRSGTAAIGFVWVDERSPAWLRAAEPGTRVRLPSYEPPYIVVDHSLVGVRPSRWPGRLLRVEVPPPATEEERAALERAARNLNPDAGYTRAVAVDPVEELSPSVLFGPHGGAVVRVLEAAAALDEGTAHRLAALGHPGAARAYGSAWDRWLADQPNGAPYLGQGHLGVLATPGAGASRSPIGHGFMTVYRAVWESARRRGGPEAFTFDDDDGDGDEDGEEVLREPWSTALRALLHAAMAFGAPHLVDGPSAAVLAEAWTAVFGPADPNTGT